ncbi:hypothetical protein KC345_g8332 [Hortaea werneckii]|nr:hypothetical protein KC345_g8332 [Hortaea werneckii]
MDRLTYGRSLDRCDWKHDTDDDLNLMFIEGWQYEGDVKANDSNFARGRLSSEVDLDAWLARTSGLPDRQRQEKLTGCIRMLVCDRSQYAPLDFALSRRAFEAISSAFHLSPLTISSFESEFGTYSRFLDWHKNDPKKLRRVRTVLKVPQKREIFNWGVSTCYDVDSGATTALLYGTGLGWLSYDRPQHDRHKECGTSAFDMLVDSVKAATPFWNCPWVLPSLFLSEHLSCVNAFATRGKVLTETVHIEHALGVTKVGQSAYLTKSNKRIVNDVWKDRANQVQLMDIPETWKESRQPLTKEETEKLTVRINTQSTRVAFTARCPEWNLACTRYILQLLEDVQPCLPVAYQRGEHECKQLLEHNLVLADAAVSNFAVIKERMALQLNVLYQFVAQLDNQTSAELAKTSANLAASTSRDSTSMKILAFISALFLPGSFDGGYGG